MSPIEPSWTDGIGTVTLRRGKVNALDHASVRDLSRVFGELERDGDTRAVVLTGAGKFFSFGFDVPELFDLTKERFIRFLVDFTDLYRLMFLFPKPLIGGLNGHTIAGGCMLALACDRRIMPDNAAKISLNEISFGASVFAGSVEMLRACVGHRNAESVLYTGRMYGGAEALGLGLVDRIAPAEQVQPLALEEARELANRDSVAFRSIKGLLRKPVAETMRRAEMDSIREFADIWYSESTRRHLREIRIHG